TLSPPYPPGCGFIVGISLTHPVWGEREPPRNETAAAFTAAVPGFASRCPLRIAQPLPLAAYEFEMVVEVLDVTRDHLADGHAPPAVVRPVPLERLRRQLP